MKNTLRFLITSGTLSNKIQNDTRFKSFTYRFDTYMFYKLEDLGFILKDYPELIQVFSNNLSNSFEMFVNNYYQYANISIENIAIDNKIFIAIDNKIFIKAMINETLTEDLFNDNSFKYNLKQQEIKCSGLAFSQQTINSIEQIAQSIQAVQNDDEGVHINIDMQNIQNAIENLQKVLKRNQKTEMERIIEN